MNLLKLSWKNIINKPLSMLLSLILFALGVGMISLLLLLNDQLQNKFDKNLAGIDLVIGAKGSPLQMILCNMYHIDSPTGNVSIKEVRPFLNPKHPLIKKAVPLSLGDSHKSYRIVGTTHDLVALYLDKKEEEKQEVDPSMPRKPKPFVGVESYGQDEILSAGKLWIEDFEVTIGAAVASDLNLKLGDTFSSSHGFVLDDNLVHEDASELKVVGILQPTGAVVDQLILTNTQTVWKVHGDHAHEEGEEHAHDDHAHDEHDHDHAHDHAHDDGHTHEPVAEKLVDDEPKSLMDEVDKDITSLLVLFKHRNFQTLNMMRSINENTDMQAATPAFEINRLYSMLGVGTDALQVLALVIILVSGISIFISLFSSLKERRYELSLMRVMGASRGTLFLLIIIEGLILAFLGFILGMLLSHGGMEVLATYMKGAYRYSFDGWLFLKEEIWLLLGALTIGLIAAIIPAFLAFKTDISETLSKG